MDPYFYFSGNLRTIISDVLNELNFEPRRLIFQFWNLTTSNTDIAFFTYDSIIRKTLVRSNTQ